MPKKNSLKVVPFVPHEKIERTYDESLRPSHRANDDRTWEAYFATEKTKIIFQGHMMLDYTQGSPGDQSTSGWGTNGNVIDWRDNEPFEATLILRSMARGRSATRFWFEDEANKVYYPFFGDTAIEVLKAATLPHGAAHGTWIAVKKGSNYGIEPYTP